MKHGFQKCVLLIDEPTTKGATLGNAQGGTVCEDDETTSMSTDCIRGDIPTMMRFPGAFPFATKVERLLGCG
eukprot:2713028-Amphidinium_carterae.1